MNLTFEAHLADAYKSKSQQARVLTEQWVSNFIFCPNCGHCVEKYPNNQPVADFYCPQCKEDYELKSKQHHLGIKITDGAYQSMIDRLQSSQNPNFFFLNYDLSNYEVLNFLVIPKYFFTPNIIEKRTPLAPTARRAGWIGCNILLEKIPHTGKIFFVKNKQIKPKEIVLHEWEKTLFLQEEKELNARGWLLDVMMCLDKLKNKDFSLNNMYSFENYLQQKHPDNHHIKDKIRQQLQVLRDKGYLEFVGRGSYKLV